VISLSGSVAAAGEGLIFTVDETKRLEQRRGAFRLAVACPVHVLRGKGERLDYRTGDLSLTGVRILDADELLDEELVGLEIELDERTVELIGKVVRRDGLSIGVSFAGLPAAAEDEISKFIAEAQRLRLRRAA
jgi:c-di-GMP-binding flagellar brake protein YcgR